MRGKHGHDFHDPYSNRNIPAYAGKTICVRRKRILQVEHPRVCGENVATSAENWFAKGTSPRMRGKRAILHLKRLPLRNIPAYAGKTHPQSSQPCSWPEHPCVCGENRLGPPAQTTDYGTSPRMRGKRNKSVGKRFRARNIPAYAGKQELFTIPPSCFRNIPAYAGKTSVIKALRLGPQEHPRVCGENCAFHLLNPVAEGTSPRMRGKLLPGSGH